MEKRVRMSTSSFSLAMSDSRIFAMFCDAFEAADALLQSLVVEGFLLELEFDDGVAPLAAGDHGDIGFRVVECVGYLGIGARGEREECLLLQGNMNV